MIPDPVRLVIRQRETLPYPSLSAPVLRAVEDALLAAFRRVAAGGDLLVLERSLNDRMVRALDELQSASQVLDRVVFGDVHRGPEYEDFRAVALENRPDIVIGLTTAPPGALGRRHHAIFVECKRIHHELAKTVKLYVERGMRRFEDGAYAWKMRDGILLAYVFDATNPALSLAGAERVDRPDVADATLLVSSHPRTWRYVSGADPGPIRLLHVWVAAPPRAADLG